MALKRIGLIDFGDLPIIDMVGVAQHAEALGYHRYWLAEHYPGRTYRNSLLMTPIIAGVTTRMRVGPAGVLVRYYAPAAVADDGAFLESVFGGRIDLGLAAGVLTDDVAPAFADGRTGLGDKERFAVNARGVREWLDGKGAHRPPPEVWLLGASDRPETGELAAEIDASFSLSLWIARVTPSPRPIQAYLDACEKRAKRKGAATLAVNLACVASEKERVSYENAHVGCLGVPFVDVASRCRERLEELSEEYGVEEITVLETSIGSDRRRASLAMLADAFTGTPVFSSTPNDGLR